MNRNRFRNLLRTWSARMSYKTFTAHVGPCVLKKRTSSFICGRSTKCRRRCTYLWKSLYIPSIRWASSSMRKSTISTSKCSRSLKRWLRVKRPALYDWLVLKRSCLRLDSWRRSGCRSGTTLLECFPQVTLPRWLVNWLLTPEVVYRLLIQDLHSQACKRHRKREYKVRPQQL
jgi:hypothetical protein